MQGGTLNPPSYPRKRPTLEEREAPGIPPGRKTPGGLRLLPLGPDHQGLCWLRAHPGAVPGGEPPSVTLGASTWCLNSTSRGQQPSVTAPSSPGMQAVMWPPDLGGPARSREDAQEAGPSCPAHHLLLAPASLSPGHSHSHFSALCWSLQPQYLLPCPALGLHLYKLEPRVPGLWSLRILGYQPEISS